MISQPTRQCLLRQLAQLQAENAKLRQETAALHLALFHVENGLAHPDERVRKLIEAAEAAKENEDAGK